MLPVTTLVTGYLAMEEHLYRAGEHLSKIAANLRLALQHQHQTEDGATSPRDIGPPPWAIGSGLGGLLTPGGNTGSGDPDPSNTTLPPDGSGG